jgi:hypothetical protein
MLYVNTFIKSTKETIFMVILGSHPQDTSLCLWKYSKIQSTSQYFGRGYVAKYYKTDFLKKYFRARGTALVLALAYAALHEAELNPLQHTQYFSESVQNINIGTLF